MNGKILTMSDAAGIEIENAAEDRIEPIAGQGHMIHTYSGDGNPLPSFSGEPKTVGIPDDIDAFTDLLWSSLNEENKVSLFVRYIDVASGAYESRIRNKNI